MNDEAYEKINSMLNSYDWKAKLSNKNVDDCFEEWHSTVQSTIYQIAPEREVKLTKKQLKHDPWITSNLLKSCTRQKKLYKLALKSKNNPETWNKYHAYKVILDRVKRFLKKDYYQSKCIAFKHNSRKLWKIINEIKGKCNDKGNIIECIKTNNISYYDAKKHNE